MQITSGKNYNPNFQARQIARTMNCIGKLETKIDLWEVTSRDKTFLKGLLENIDFKNLMPNISSEGVKRWKEMLEISVNDTVAQRVISYLAISENKPCGIISFVPGKKQFYASSICTWPIECGKKVKFAGKTLFYQLFKTFSESKAKEITLKAIKDGPFETVPKYKNIGFQVLDDKHLVEMSINKYKVKEVYGDLNKIITYTPLEKQSERDLEYLLHL